MYKFRAWDKKNKCYIPEWQDATRLIEKHGFNGGDQFIVEQCTGGTDTDFFDVYEGSIVTALFFAPDESFCATGVVRWCKNRLSYVVDCNFNESDSLSEWLGCRIIGTVNENTELLNEQKGNDNDTSTNTKQLPTHQ